MCAYCVHAKNFPIDSGRGEVCGKANHSSSAIVYELIHCKHFRDGDSCRSYHQGDGRPLQLLVIPPQLYVSLEYFRNNLLTRQLLACSFAFWCFSHYLLRVIFNTLGLLDVLFVNQKSRKEETALNNHEAARQTSICALVFFMTCTVVPYLGEILYVLSLSAQAVSNVFMLTKC